MTNESHDEKDRLQTLYRALNEPITEVDGFTPPEVTKYLRENGIEPTRLQTALNVRISEIERRLRLQRAQADYRNVAGRIGRIGNHVAATIGEAKENVLQRLKGLHEAQPELARAMFNKFEQADDADFQALYEDLKRLDQLNGDALKD